MRRLALSTLIAVSWTAAAQAADYGYLPPGGYGPPPPAYPPGGPGGYTINEPFANSWAGAYLGGNVSYQWGSVSNNPAKPSGFAGGVQAGYNFQTSPCWVFGIEGDLQATGADDTFAPWKFSNPWFGTVRGRVGYSFGNVMVYGTGGLAFGEIDGQTFGLSESHATAGWTLGLGAEFGFARDWSAKVEYLYVNLAETPFSITGVSNDYQFGVFRVGVNYHFN